MNAIASIPVVDLPPSAWVHLSPLPDPVGFGGMFAGVLGGILVCGGGSQFRDAPFWLGGRKDLSDRIFTLVGPAARWVEHAERLPEKLGHFACAPGAEAIYLVGGLNGEGSLSRCWTVCADGNRFRFERLPDLAAPVCHAAAVVAGSRLIVAGGLRQPADKTALAEVWSLDLTDPRAWRREPDLPGPGVFVATAAATGRQALFFGGAAFSSGGALAPSRRAYAFDTERRRHEVLPDLPAARVGAASPCPLLSNGNVLVIGGYAEVFSGVPREHPGFDAQTLAYDPARRHWSHGPVLPCPRVANRDATGDAGAAPMAVAPSAVWRDLAVVVSGEVRSSVRTSAVVAWPLAAELT